MKASELRIGNYVQGKEFNHPRLGIYSDGVTEIMEGGILAFARSVIYYEPIPLTEEWLIKFGFEIIHHDFNFFVKRVKIEGCNSISIRIWENNGWNFGLYQHDGGIDITIEYVHQLQNLFFALTQEELQIKSL